MDSDTPFVKEIRALDGPQAVVMSGIGSMTGEQAQRFMSRILMELPPGSVILGERDGIEFTFEDVPLVETRVESLIRWLASKRENWKRYRDAMGGLRRYLRVPHVQRNPDHWLVNSTNDSQGVEYHMSFGMLRSIVGRESLGDPCSSCGSQKPKHLKNCKRDG